MLERDKQFALVNLNRVLKDEGRKFLFQSRPGDCLGLLQKRGNVEEQAEFLLEPDRLVNQFHDGKFGLAGATMQSQHSEPALTDMASALPCSWLVLQTDGASH